MFCTQNQWKTILRERQDDHTFGPMTYSRVYRAISSLCKGSDRTKVYSRLTDTTKTSKAYSTFIQNSVPKVEWFESQILPRIKEIRGELEGYGRRANSKFKIDGQEISGGPHIKVLWEDDSERLIYFIGARYTRKRIRSLLTLLQIYGREVDKIEPQRVLIVDLERRELVANFWFDPDGEREAIRKVRKLRRLLQKRAS